VFVRSNRCQGLALSLSDGSSSTVMSFLERLYPEVTLRGHGECVMIAKVKEGNKSAGLL